MSDTAKRTPAIELAPDRRVTTRRVLTGARRGAGRLHPALAAAVVLAVFVQVYLIGAYVFGAGAGALDAHRTVGFIAHGLEVLVLIVALIAWLPRRDLALSALLALIGTVQISLAGEHRWVGGLHPLFALVVLVLAAALVLRSRDRPHT
ncbi:hypothetical protein [Capillimicrobium parvum]|uniref:Uncharacterized protein n=1 Tax=Capillimicrobium parvum TaxID=2884022 RepID=A0A9E6Y2J7_9ACTN|nr:hypothetical protein [Capillimicrobium parvum]UGS38393.1 hypothetical protein DSM104329_04819 [Capillimicrobium parvum]